MYFLFSFIISNAVLISNLEGFSANPAVVEGAHYERGDYNQQLEVDIEHAEEQAAIFTRAEELSNHDLDVEVEGVLTRLSAPAAKDEFQTALACSGRSVHLRCPGDYTIQIIHAFYGREARTTQCPRDPVDDHDAHCETFHAVDVARRHCNSKEECILRASNRMFYDPCHSLAKYLNVTYTCSETHYYEVCPGIVETVQCPPGHAVVIDSAFYGMEAGEQSPCDQEASPTGQEDACSSQAALINLRALCDNQALCEIPVTDAVFENPCNGADAYLKFSASCNDIVSEEVCLWEGVSLQCPEGLHIQILDVFFGMTAHHRTSCSSIRRVGLTDCFTQDAAARLKSVCEGEVSCSVADLQVLFGDPCPDAEEYLKFDYVCAE